MNCDDDQAQERLLLVDVIRLLPELSLTDEDEACLLLLILTACARGTNDTDRPFLRLIQNNPDPTQAQPANTQEAGALQLLKKIYAKPSGAAFYGRIHNGAGAAALNDVQPTLTAAAIAITGLNSIWDLDPPHPRGTA